MQTKKKKTQSLDKQIEALSRVAKAIASDLYLEDILRLIVTVTAEVMGSKICSILLLDEKKGELVIKATQSVSEEYNKKPNIKIGEGIAGQVAQNGEPIVVKNVRKDARYANIEIARKEGLCSLLSVPLKVKDRVTGVLNSYTSRPHKFTKSEIRVLTAVANQAAIVIENAELMVRSRVIAAELETRKIVEKAKGVLMKARDFTEEEAYKKLQKKSMDTRKSLREVAEAVLLAEEMKK